MTVVFAIIGCAILFLMILAAKSGLGFPWVEFYVRGKESGFKFSEINVLRKVAVESRMKEPAALYWSQRQLDRCIAGAITRSRAQGNMDAPGTINFLQKLFDFRKRVEFNQPKYRTGLRSSRNMTKGQKVRIPLSGIGVFESVVVENIRHHISLSYPKGAKRLPPGHSWLNLKIDVFFWRAEDAEYYFETSVLTDNYDKKIPTLSIAHSDNLIRAQKRGSVRLAISLPVSLYPLRSIAAANEFVEARQGYRGRMIDLSEDGFAVKVGGKAKPGMPIKIQLALDEEFILMCGIVKTVTYNQETNQSILHAQASKPSPGMKIAILTQVYGIFSRKPEISAAEDIAGVKAASPGETGTGEKPAGEGGLAWDLAGDKENS
jgi:c-di-GMP-binding flagellar brake protein YcgR